MKTWEILLKDLCMRLPYGPECIIKGVSDPKKLIQITADKENSLYLFEGGIEVYSSEVKPILISPKTLYKDKEVRKELVQDLNNSILKDIDYLNTFDWSGSRKFQWAGYNELDFYLRCGIDIFGLIDKGIAYERDQLSNT